MFELFQKHFVAATNVSYARKQGNIVAETFYTMFFRNNVSLFAGTNLRALASLFGHPTACIHKFASIRSGLMARALTAELETEEWRGGEFYKICSQFENIGSKILYLYLSFFVLMPVNVF